LAQLNIRAIVNKNIVGFIVKKYT